MIIKIIGAEHKQGSFQGKDYDNVIVYFTCPFSDGLREKDFCFGERTNFMKAKSSILPFDKAYEFFVDGTFLDVYFDQYQNPVLFNPITI